MVGLVAVPARAADEPRLADTSERLTTEEEKGVRDAVLEHGPITAGMSADNPFHRVLVLPKVLKPLYEKKPQATVRFLLKIVEVGRTRDSVHAVCCIEALIKNPEFAAITAQGSNADKWDEVIGGANPYTFREHSRRVCVEIIAEKEHEKATKEKK
jgi:hypothetical protein